MIHNEQKFLEEIEMVKQYILEELNVRCITLSCDKVKYGVSLRAEPDHKTLGVRLKSAFKDVMLGIKVKFALKFEKRLTFFIINSFIFVLLLVTFRSRSAGIFKKW